MGRTIVKILKKTVRIGIWTLCCLSFALLSSLLIEKPRGVFGSLEMVASIDPFLASLALFISVVAAFIVDLWYTSRFGSDDTL